LPGKDLGKRRRKLLLFEFNSYPTDLNLVKPNDVNPDESHPCLGPDAALPSGEGCWTRERLELKAWLGRNARSLAELYEGAVRLLFELRLPGYTRFVGHAVREIRNRLPSVISGSTSGEQLQYKNRLDEIIKICKKSGFPTDGTLPVVASVPNPVESRPTNCVLPFELAHSFTELIGDHEKARERPRDTAKRLFIGLRPENQKFVDTLRPAITQWLEVTGWFMSITHDNDRVDAGVDGNELVQKFELFETTLNAIVQQFFTTTDALDEILEETNS
jgi:hypothetical protein